jgi:hypothetical protein
MTMATPVQKAWRNDPEKAAQIMKKIFPIRPEYDLVLTQLSESIHQATSVAPKAWAVTLFPDRFRLNVGNVEVLTASLGEIRLLIHRAVDTIHRELVDCIEIASYKSVPGDNFIFQGSIEQFRRYRDVLLPGHYDFIDEAGRTKSGTPRSGTRYRASHSPGLVDLAESVTPKPDPA